MSTNATPAQQADSVAQALAGAGGGALAMVVTYPLITLSTRAQTERRKSMSAESSETLPPPTTTTTTTTAGLKNRLMKKPSLVSAAGKIIQREGVSGLYSGLESALFGISITNFVYYYFYEGTRALFERRKRIKGAAAIAATGTMSTLESMIAGAIAGSATVILTNPIWVVNTRQTVRASPSSAKKLSVIETVKDILSTDGPRAFFAGLVPALMLVINPILQYTIFERLRAVIERRRKLRPLDFFILGAIGKLVATTATYPYITVKSRMQVQRRNVEVKDGEKADSEVYTSTFSALKQIAGQEGWTSLYSGIDSKIVQSVLTSAFLFYFKEQLVSASVKTLQIVRRQAK
ncbi:mitochondrial carrier domain-containing protein [Lipomyces tetrasporus]|uniref:Mitochondrial carrier domain-containing protein n=1 Tax=Lipomyces tetrasporus TaxID=54092 RepID=A0AAD7QQ57_9ASCO|nr:mitochondrial carrier domain-containing protein [Lipomyces tetrasporus]KAJ8099439.1 mitochondrial carrier domain-containing protein [Lipomyces tetrasporus]